MSSVFTSPALKNSVLVAPFIKFKIMLTEVFYGVYYSNEND